jgi:vacuolar protein sorting-associated protein 13A/C
MERELRGADVPFYLKDHTNSLNINVSTALIETGMEALKILKGEM